MLIGLREILKMGEKHRFAVPAFNVYNTETVMAVAAAAQEACAPVIMQVYSRLVKEGGAYYLAPSILAAAERATVPVCFHLDHGSSEMEMIRAMRWGATGIMLDGSSYSFEENVAMTAKAVESAGALNIAVEGELGHVGSVNDTEMGEFTGAEEAVRFVEETGVAALAVLVGNAHGRYKKPPKLDIGRIAEIYEASGRTPLVLHGGSGIPDDQIRLAVEAGIRKMNFSTDVCYTFLDAIQKELERPDKKVALDLFMDRPVEAVKEFCLGKIRLLGAEGMAEGYGEE